MHAWPIFWALKTPKNVPITAESTYARGGNPRQEKTMCLFLFFFCPERGRVTDRWGIGMYEMNCYMLRRFEKNASFFFDLPSSFVDPFTRWFTRCERRTERKSGQRDGIFMGKKSLAGGTCGSGNFTLSPRYKVCMIETERDFIFIFTFTFIYFCFFFSKGFDETLMYCPKERKERRKRKRTSSRASDDR